VAIAWKQAAEVLYISLTVPTGSTATLELEGMDAVALAPGEHYYFLPREADRIEKCPTQVL
jgi:hypothetical protein